MPFFNIFSKKLIKNKTEIQQKIIVDNREKNSLVIAELINLNLKLEYRQLPIADYIIGEIAIERKTISDLISSMLNKRLFQQLENLKQYKKSLLILEGYENLNLKDTNLNENAIKGLLLSISLDNRIPILFSKNEKETALFLSLIAKKKKTEISLRAKLQMSDSQRLQFILEGFPSIGPKTAQKLLLKYKTIKNIINAPYEELISILGKKADIFLSLLEKKYNKI